MKGRVLDRDGLKKGWELIGQRGPWLELAPLLAGNFGLRKGWELIEQGRLLPELVPLLVSSGGFGELIGQGGWPGPISASMKTWGCGLKKARRGVKLEVRA